MASRIPRTAGRSSAVAAQLVALRVNTTARTLGVLTAEQKDYVANVEGKEDWNVDLYEVLVRIYGLSKRN